MIFLYPFSILSQKQLGQLCEGPQLRLCLLHLLRHCWELAEDERLLHGFAGAEELALLVARVFLAADICLLVVLGDLAPLAHFLDARSHLHSQ